MGKELHIYVKILADESCCEILSRHFSFVSEKIDQEGASMMRPDGDIGSQVTWQSSCRTVPVGNRSGAGRSICM